MIKYGEKIYTVLLSARPFFHFIGRNEHNEGYRFSLSYIP